tara:strand:+ start:13556 stop:15367 length:1812 start_codon:yes stop_codon:yes gene_type:complete
MTLGCGDSSKDNIEVKIKNDVPLSLPPPFLAFTDLISGPSTGIADGLGSGVIVTAWGFNLGSDQGESSVEYCDNKNNCQSAAHIYYWKNADGKLPSGPANLYESHGMQEISFSIPESEEGLGTIKLKTSNGETSIAFTVRPGQVYHVKNSGNDQTGDGSFNNPWLTIANADKIINAGSTLYVHNITTGDENTSLVIYNNRLEAMSNLEAQFSYVAYPNTRPEAIGERVFSTYTGSKNMTSGFVLSKFSIYAAEADEDENNQPVNVRANVSFGIEGTRDGRAIGNYITDAHPSDLTGACPDAQQAAITASSQGSDKVSNFKIFGNHIENYGCNGTTRFQHTTYLTIRSAQNNEQLIAPEMAWNYLQDNKASSGLHYFDENYNGEECGQFTTTVKIHDNIVINQSGPAISFGANCPVNTTFEYYNNIAINVGLKADFDDITTNGSENSAVTIAIGHPNVTAKLNFNNNIFYTWSADNQQEYSMACIGLRASYDNAVINWDSNICYTQTDLSFIRSNYQGDSMESKFSGENNVWFSEVIFPFNAIPPAWDVSPILIDPMISFIGSKIKVQDNSPLKRQSQTPLLRDIYGQLRTIPSTVGAVQFIEN